ncbi:hypothetical protein LUZ60_017119 [Juncus effusus]|nr:hypothetical protein LUZ60_017119 [Juncus effusus]
MHQLAGGLYVSGPQPETPSRDRRPSGTGPVPYTGGDVGKSGELGRMFDIQPGSVGPSIGSVSSPRVSSRVPSGQLNRPSPSPSAGHSGPLSQLQYSGLLVGPSPSRSPSVSSLGSARRVVKQSVPVVKEGQVVFGLPFWGYLFVVVVLTCGVGIGIFILYVSKKFIILLAVAVVVILVVLLALWNFSMKNREGERYFRQLNDSIIDREHFPVGDLIKITGQVTCGHLPLSAAYHDVSRCVYTSIDLYEHQGSNSSSNPNPKLWNFKWELRHSAKHVVNFYISDKNTGNRFLVRAGEGAKIISFVKSKTIKINKDKGDISSNFLNWLDENNISSNSQAFRVKEGFIKEGDVASVIGVLKRQHNYNIIDPIENTISTGFQFKRCMIPLIVEGLIILRNENSDDDLIYVV